MRAALRARHRRREDAAPLRLVTAVGFRREVQVFPLSSYRDELAGEHYIRGLTTDALRSYIRSVVPAVCLPNEYRD